MVRTSNFIYIYPNDLRGMISTAVLDIEGTVCPISFVHDTLFPFALRKARSEIPKLNFPLKKGENELANYLLDFPPQYLLSANTLIDHIEDLVKNDVKIGYLKSLQGYLWKSGYESGELKAPLFDEVKDVIQKWSKESKVVIYSSGSVPAQKLFFKYTTQGDLTPFLSGYYDTNNAGPKTDPESYLKISKDLQTYPQNIRFFSDNPKEITAAHEAQFHTTFIVRPGNPVYDFTPPEDKDDKLSNI